MKRDGEREINSDDVRTWDTTKQSGRNSNGTPTQNPHILNKEAALYASTHRAGLKMQKKAEKHTNELSVRAGKF